MSVNTANAYGNISISEEAIAQVAGYAALECYGVVELRPKNIFRRIVDLLKRSKTSMGVKVKTNGDRIHLVLYVNFKYGVSINAVAQSLVRAVRYDVERFTGMVVETVNVNVYGIKI